MSTLREIIFRVYAFQLGNFRQLLDTLNCNLEIRKKYRKDDGWDCLSVHPATDGCDLGKNN